MSLLGTKFKGNEVKLQFQEKAVSQWRISHEKRQ